MKLTTPYEHARWLARGTDRVSTVSTDAMRAVQAYAGGSLSQWVLVLAGRATGCGKSFAAAWLAARLDELAVEQDDRVARSRLRAGSGAGVWVTCGALASLKGLWPSERETIAGRIRGAWYAVLDDVGTEPDAGVVQALLEHRRQERLLTIVTTNLVDASGPRAGMASQEWLARYDSRLSSRLAAPGDREAGRVTAWVHCEGPDLRSQASPRLVEAELAEEPEIAIDFDALARPLLESTDPRRLDEAAANERDASASYADAARRKVWGGLALDELAERALVGDEAACDVLDAVQRRARG